MRIGLVVYDGLNETSGGYLYDRQIVAGLRDRGHAVTTVAIPRRGYGRDLLDNLSSAVWEELSALADRTDLLLEDELCHPSLVLPNRRLRHRFPGLPIVSIVHHLRASERWGSFEATICRRLERAYLETVDGFVYNSRATRATVESLVGQRSRVLAPPGGDHIRPDIDRAAIRSRGREPGPLRVLFVGSVVERKGLTTLIRGLADGEFAWSLTAVGDTSIDPAYVARVRSLVTHRGLDERVTLTGRVGNDRLAELYRRHHVLAVPSWYEGYGIAYLEGMGYGLPAVGSRAGGASEVIADGTTGRLVEPGNTKAVRAAIAPLAGDRDRLVEYSLAARRAFETHHGWDETAGAVGAFLTAVADG